MQCKARNREVFKARKEWTFLVDFVEIQDGKNPSAQTLFEKMTRVSNLRNLETHYPNIEFVYRSYTKKI